MPDSYQFFDTHAHLDDPQLAGRIDDYISNAWEAGVTGITAIGTTVASSRTCVEIADRFEGVYAAVGIHPNKCADASERDWDGIIELAGQPRVVALGETGLDRHWDYCPFEIQVQWFDRHIELSRTTGKPIVVHMRDCEADILNTIARHAGDGELNGIMHSFAGSRETAELCLAAGMHISFAGMVTFRKSDTLREIAAMIPADRLLIETDSPYLSPEPHRNQRPNEPALVAHTARCLAEVRGVTLEQLARTTTANAKKLFGI